MYSNSPQTGTLPSRLPSLTGMRFVAAAMVFACHIAVITKFVGGPIGDALPKLFAMAGPYAVGFFFILSGFVLTWTARPDDTRRRFWRRRLVKIFPNHLVTFALAGALMVAAGHAVAAVDWLPNLFLLHSWVPRLATSTSMNGVSWSLSCELFFYLSFPLLLALIDRIGRDRLWLAVGVVVALMVAAVLVAQFLISDQPRLTLIASGSLSFAQIWFVYFFPPVRALEFVLGMLLARIVTSGRWPALGMLPAAAIAAAGYALTLFVPFLFGTGGLASMWIAPLIATAACADSGGRPSPFRGAVLVRLGDLSFAFYMVHWMVVVASAQLVRANRGFTPPVGFAVILAVFAVSLGLAWLLYRSVEDPIVRRFSRSRRVRRPAEARSGALAAPAGADLARPGGD